MKRTTAFALLAIMIFTLCACEKKAEASWQEQYDLGMKYLNEGNYEEAVIAFDAAIKIDPKRPEAYIGLADAYIALGDTEKARSVLEQGYNATGNEALKKHLEDEDSRTWAMSDFVAPQELTLGGVPYYEVDINSVSEIYPELPGISGGFPPDSGHYSANGFFCSTIEGGDPSKIGTFSYHYNPDFETRYQPEFRGLKTGMSPENALACLGFTPEGIEYILNSEHEGGGVFGTKAVQQEWQKGVTTTEKVKNNEFPSVNWSYEDFDNSGDNEYLLVDISWMYEIGEQVTMLVLGFRNGILETVQIG